MSNELELFNNKLKLESDAVFLENKDKSLTFNQFKKFAKNISLKLEKLKPGSLVLIDIRDPFYFAGFVFACFHLKLKPALLNHYFKNDQIDKVLKSNSYSLFVTDQDHNFETLKINSASAFEFTEGAFDIDPHSEILFFTSGSVQSKACVLTLANFLYSALGSHSNIPFVKTNKWGLLLPLFHVGGFSILARALVSEGTVSILDNNKNFPEQLDQMNVTHMSFVSTQFIKYLEQFEKIGSLKYILLGGSAIPELMLKKSIEMNLPIYKSYGMTEMASQICTTPRLTSSSDLNLSGHLLKYREIKISDGQIYVQGPCLFKGYLANDVLESARDTEGWFSTNDKGVIHHKEIQVLGRADRIFQSAGENISPEVIEQELLRVPGVLKAYVCPESDTQYGLRAVAYIDKLPSLKDQDILGILKGKLPGLYRPKTLKPWSESPKSSWKS